RQPQSGAWLVAAINMLLQLNKFIKNLLLVFSSDANASVNHSDLDRLAPPWLARLHPNRSAFRRELQGIIQQIDEHLLQPLRIRYQRGQPRGKGGGKRNLFLPGFMLEQGHHTADEGAQI